ncbi:hypothetical protein ACJJTC_005166 [Scirpophaga incertulas]
MQTCSRRAVRACRARRASEGVGGVGVGVGGVGVGVRCALYLEAEQCGHAERGGASEGVGGVGVGVGGVGVGVRCALYLEAEQCGHAERGGRVKVWGVWVWVWGVWAWVCGVRSTLKQSSAGMQSEAGGAARPLTSAQGSVSR